MQIRKKSPQLYDAVQNTGDLSQLVTWLSAQTDFEHMEVRKDLKVRVFSVGGSSFTLAANDYLFNNLGLIDKVSALNFSDNWEVFNG